MNKLGGLNRYLIEPYETFQERSRVVYEGGARRHNIRGLVELQRQCSREQFCKTGALYPQEKCDDDSCLKNPKVGCSVAMSTIDGGHNAVSPSDMYCSTSLNGAVVLRL